MSSQEWKNDALCKDLPIEEVDKLFFVGVGQSAKRAKLFCSQCSVRITCLNYALTYKEDGTWGGQTEEERESLDSQIVNMIREREYTANGREDRNLDHFIPKARQSAYPRLSSLPGLDQMIQEIEKLTDSLLESMEEPTVMQLTEVQQEEQLAAQDLPSLDPTDLRASGL